MFLTWSDSPVIRSIVHMLKNPYRQDMLSSTALASRPTFEPMHEVYDDGNTGCTHREALLKEVGGVSEYEWFSLEGCLAQIRHLTNEMNEVHPRLALTASQIMAFSQKRSSIAHRLASLPYKDADKMKVTDYLHDVCRLAALIYVNCMLHASNTITAILKTLKTQLVGLIQEAEEKFAPVSNAYTPPPESVWILFVGGILSLNEEEEVWFATRIVFAMRGLGLEDWEDVEEVLLKIAWADELRTPACLSLWRRMKEIRSSRSHGPMPHIQL